MRLATLWAAALLAFLCTAPALTTAALGQEADPVFAELRKVQALEKAGRTDEAAFRVAKLCLESPDPAKGINFACDHMRNTYKSHALYDQVAEGLCARGSAMDCFGLYAHLDSEGDPATIEKRELLLGNACVTGEAGACGLLGGALLSGRLGKRDPAQAARAPNQGCRLGDTEICADFLDHATALRFGVSNPEIDDKVFAATARRACPPAPASASARSCLAAAEAVDFRLEGEELAMVRLYLARACRDYRESEACFWLAEDYANGDSGPVNREAAAKVLADACRLEPGYEACS